MNLALPALVILLGLLPGICCFYGYFAGRFDKRTAGVSGVEELALYVLFAIPIDVSALWLYRQLGIGFDFTVATHLLAGNLADAAVHNEVATYFQRSVGLNARAYLVVLLAGFAIGSLGRRFVWACRLDTKVPYLRIKHGWFYILQGRVAGLPRVVASYVDVLTTLPDKDGSQTRLYRGLVVDFEISPSGGIESLTLERAMRGKGRGDQFAWMEIPSTKLLIMGGTIHSINVTYLAIEKPNQSLRLGGRLRVWLRSFAFEEP